MNARWGKTAQPSATGARSLVWDQGAQWSVWLRHAVGSARRPGLEGCAARRARRARGVDVAVEIDTASTMAVPLDIKADLAMKETAWAQFEPPDTEMRKFRALDALMRFLQSL